MWVSRGIELYPQNGGQAAVVDAWAVHGIWWIAFGFTVSFSSFVCYQFCLRFSSFFVSSILSLRRSIGFFFLSSLTVYLRIQVSITVRIFRFSWWNVSNCCTKKKSSSEKKKPSTTKVVVKMYSYKIFVHSRWLRRNAQRSEQSCQNFTTGRHSFGKQTYAVARWPSKGALKKICTNSHKKRKPPFLFLWLLVQFFFQRPLPSLPPRHTYTDTWSLYCRNRPRFFPLLPLLSPPID